MKNSLAARSAEGNRMAAKRFSQQTRLFGVTSFLALAGIAGALILAHSDALALATMPVAQRANAPAGNVQNGKTVFANEKCAGCHGNQGEGGTGTIAGPRIGPPRFALPMFLDAVRNSKAPMPSFSASEVSDAALTDVYAFLNTMTPPAGAAAMAAPAGNAQNGQRLFTSAGCWECHDHEGQGGQGTGPRLAPNPIAYSAFVHQCRLPADEMPPYTSKVLSDAELADIYAYLLSIPKPPPVSNFPLLP